MKISKKRLYQTAIHEAAHAVIGRVLQIGGGDVTIEPDLAEMTAGYAIAEDPWDVMAEWTRQGKWRREYACALRARSLMLMAGAEANIEKGGKPHLIGDGDDRRQIGFLLEELCDDPEADAERWERRMRAKSRWLVRRHMKTIEAVADALLDRNTISAAEVDRLMRKAAGSKVRVMASADS